MQEGLRELALFAGAGGGILGGKLLGWRTVCAVECDAYAASVLVARQNDGILEAFPIWDDVRTFDGRPWRGFVDVVSGGFPCQDISAAGKGEGINGNRSGLWKEFARIIGEVRPRYAFIENSPMLALRGGDQVLSDLAALGYDCRWGIISAADAGAPHLRKRIWILASDSKRSELRDEPRGIGGKSWSGAAKFADNGEQRIVADTDGGLRDGRADEQEREVQERVAPSGGGQDVADAGGERLQASECQTIFGAWGRIEGRTTAECSWWDSEPDVGRVANGVASRVDKLKCLGNGQVPSVAALAWQILAGRENQ
jgi:DNA (cytosine-5)-methyltransferase 1